MKATTKATLIGLIAPVGWGTTVGLVRDITTEFGLFSGLTILYGAIVALLLAINGFPKLSSFSKKYLFLGLPFSNICSILFCVSMFLCQNERQTVEVGMVNYMWPCLVILFAIIINGQRARWWVSVGILVSMLGVMIVLGGDGGIGFDSIARNVSQNPASYILAFLGALSWGIYSNLTQKWARGQNPTVLIFIVDFLIFGAFCLFGYGDFSGASMRGWFDVALGAVALGIPYWAWNYAAVRGGSLTVMSIASYFTPVLSCIFASMWIGAKLGPSLMVGVCILVVGSTLTFLSTKKTREGA